MANAENELLERYLAMSGEYQSNEGVVNDYLNAERQAMQEMDAAGRTRNAPDSKWQRHGRTAAGVLATIAAIADKTSGNRNRRRAAPEKYRAILARLRDQKVGRDAEKEKLYQRRMREIQNQRSFAKNRFEATNFAIESKNRAAARRQSAVGKAADVTAGKEKPYKERVYERALKAFVDSGLSQQEFIKQNPSMGGILGIKDRSIPPEQYIQEMRGPLVASKIKIVEDLIKAGASKEEIRKALEMHSLFTDEMEERLVNMLKRAGYLTPDESDSDESNSDESNSGGSGGNGIDEDEFYDSLRDKLIAHDKSWETMLQSSAQRAMQEDERKKAMDDFLKNWTTEIAK